MWPGHRHLIVLRLAQCPDTTRCGVVVKARDLVRPHHDARERAPRAFRIVLQEPDRHAEAGERDNTIRRCHEPVQRSRVGAEVSGGSCSHTGRQRHPRGDLRSAPHAGAAQRDEGDDRRDPRRSQRCGDGPGKPHVPLQQRRSLHRNGDERPLLPWPVHEAAVPGRSNSDGQSRHR